MAGSKSNRQFTTNSVIFCTAVSCAALLASSSCSKPSAAASSRTSESPVTISIGFPSSTGQDPQRGIQGAARLISFEGLVSLARDGHPIARLAQDWRQSSDGLSWTIDLRPNALFHD